MQPLEFVSRIRKHLRIDGTGCDDCIQGICCGPCALAQEAREVRHEGHIMVRD
jgi:Cys-rich protein (TIGR01571 family)